MPVVFRCKGCGSIIFVFKRVGQDCFGLPAPSELAMKFEGCCPKCGRVLSTPSIDDVEIFGRVPQSIMESEDYYESLEPVILESHDGRLSTASISQ